MEKQSKSQQKSVKCLGFEMGGTSCSMAIGEKILQLNKQTEKYEIVSVKILQKFNVKTQNPEQTLDELFNLLKDLDYEHVGIASFGPVNLNKNSPFYGRITTTPKKEWQNFPILNNIRERLTLKTTKITIDTDVNSCAIAEYKLGNHNVVNSLAYITVGTGVGVGLIVNGQSVKGLLHPEGGHQLVKIQKQDEQFKGVCIFHGNCLEGLVSNVSIAERKQLQVEQLQDLDDNDPIWQQIGNYLAQLCVNISYTASPECIIIGGGIMNRKILYKIIRQEYKLLINGYLQHERLNENIDLYIKEPYFQETGLIGALSQ